MRLKLTKESTMAVTTRSITFPDFDHFEKENGQVDGMEYATHKLYKNNVLLVEMTYYFNFVDTIPRKWPVKVTIKEHVPCLVEDRVTE